MDVIFVAAANTTVKCLLGRSCSVSTTTMGIYQSLQAFVKIVFVHFTAKIFAACGGLIVWKVEIKKLDILPKNGDYVIILGNICNFLISICHTVSPPQAAKFFAVKRTNTILTKPCSPSCRQTQNSSYLKDILLCIRIRNQNVTHCIFGSTG